MPWSSEGWGQPGTASGSYANTEVNTLAVNIVPTPPSSWLTAADTLVTALKTAGVWQTFDLFYCFAAPSINARVYNWRDVITGLLTVNGTINYGVNQYAASNGSTGFYSTSFVVNSALATNGNAEYGHFCLNEATDGISVFQTPGGKSYSSLQASGAAINNITAALNTSTAGSWSSIYSSTAGHWVTQQNSATQLEMYLDGKTLGTSSQTNSADTGAVQIFKSAGNSYTTRQTAFVHYGSKLTAPQHLALSKALYVFLATLDVRPMFGLPSTSTGPTNVAPYKHLPMNAGTYYPVNDYLPVAGIQGRAGAYPYGLIKVTDPNYVNLFRFNTHPGDLAPFDGGTIQRCQLATDNSRTFVFGDVIDTSFSFFIESGSSMAHDGWCTISDSHDQSTGVVSVPANLLNPSDGKFSFSCYDNINNVMRESPRSTCNHGVWHNVRLAFKTGSAANGWIQGWFDGVQIWNFTGIVGNSAWSPYWWNVTLYSGNNDPGSKAVWLCNWETDYSGALPFASRITNPLPVPPLV
jgi:hypothetical protein